MTSTVDICNRALDAIGTRSVISSLNDQTPEANQCSRHYKATVEEMLEGHNWNFARRGISLAQLASASVPPPWSYEYAFPSDMLKPRYIMPVYPGVQPPPGVPITSMPNGVLPEQWRGPTVPFIISSDQDASGNAIKVILSNQYQAFMVYTATIEIPDLWDKNFQAAVAYALAAKLAIPLTGDKTIAGEVDRKAGIWVKQAQTVDANMGTITVQRHMPDFIRSYGLADDYERGGAYDDLNSGPLYRYD